MTGNKQTGKGSDQAIIGKASETLGAVLEIIGSEAFDLHDSSREDIDVLFKAWSAHVLRGAAPPGVFESDERRDWNGLVRFFKKHRENERWFVETSLGELRDLIWIFFRLIGSSQTRYQSTDRKLMQQMEKLKTATMSKSIDDLRQAALETVSVINEVSRDNLKEQKNQMKVLGDHLKGLRQQLSDAKKQLAVDPLTQLYNRRALDDHLEKARSISQFSGKSTSILMVDIDHFKKINDTHGHPAGDAVLVSFARLLVKLFPRKTDFVARYGGEEFTVVLEEDGLSVAEPLAQRLIAEAAAHQIDIGGKNLSITVSVGIAELIENEPTQRFIKRADDALYAAKKGGRNRYVVAEAPASPPAQSADYV